MIDENRLNIKTLSAFLLIIMILLSVSISGCTEDDEKGNECEVDDERDDDGNGDGNGNGTDDDNNTVPKVIIISGSTAVLPITMEVADQFMALNESIDISISGGGNSVGIMSVGNDLADIGMSSRSMKVSEKMEYNLVQIPVAHLGIAIIVHKDNPVTGVSMDQLRDVYKGDITDWSSLGWDDTEIVLVGRDPASGTRYNFEKLIDCEDQCSDRMLEYQSNGEVMDTISGNEAAIGYITFEYNTDGVKGLSIDDVSPTTGNVQDGSYPIKQTLYLIVNGYPEDHIQDFIDFFLSSDGQDIVDDEGFIKVG